MPRSKRSLSVHVPVVPAAKPSNWPFLARWANDTLASLVIFAFIYISVGVVHVLIWKDSEELFTMAKANIHLVRGPLLCSTSFTANTAFCDLYYTTNYWRPSWVMNVVASLAMGYFRAC
jgi:hypothetical protein